MKALLALLVFISVSANAAEDRVTPCLTVPVKTATGFKSFEAQLVASDNKGFHTMKIYKNEGASRTELPSVAIFHRAEGNASLMISVESREPVMVYRNRAAPTREGEMLITDGSETLKLEMTCYIAL